MELKWHTSPLRSCNIYSVLPEALNLRNLEGSLFGQNLPCGVMVWAGLAGARTFHVVSVPSEWLHTNCFPSWCQATEWIAYMPNKGWVINHIETRSGKLWFMCCDSKYESTKTNNLVPFLIDNTKASEKRLLPLD